MSAADNTPDAFGELLRRHRVRAGFSQEELAERSGISVRAISNLERGRTTRPYRRSVDLLCVALELPDQQAREMRAAGRRPPVVAPSAAVSTLPAGVADFTGRANELTMLLASADTGTVVVRAIDGMAGVGKTALAIQAAHRLADRYPDAHLFIDLHAYTAGRAPARTDAALATLLRALGMSDDRIPDDLDERAACWRAEIAGRRALIVLDNAADAAQVRTLLPGSPGTLVMVTSRRRLADLDTERTVSLDVLAPADAAELFTHIVGDHRAGADVEPVTGACGYLPLAIRIAAGRLRARPAWTLFDLLDKLGDEQRRLDELTIGDRSVATAFALSYQELDPARRLLFRRLGLHPGADIDVYAAAALAGTCPGDAERMLEDLVDVHLLDQHHPGRYQFHDLIRRHARDLARRDDPQPDRHDALTALLDYYLRAANLANHHLDPRGWPAPDDMSGLPALGGHAEALAWCQTEHANLLAVMDHAASHGHDEYAWRLPHALWTPLRIRGRYHDGIRLHTQALDAARRLGNRHAQADILRDLGGGHERLGCYPTARDHHQQALDLYRQTGDVHGQAANLATVYEQLGSYPEVLDHLQRSLALRRTLDDRWGQGATLEGIGDLHERTGRYDEALEAYRQTLTFRHTTGDQRGQAAIFTTLGVADAKRVREHLNQEIPAPGGGARGSMRLGPAWSPSAESPGGPSASDLDACKIIDRAKLRF